MKIYKAYYDSRNFSFEAFAETKAKAHAILLAGLKEHGKQYNCEPDWFMYGDSDCIEVVEYVLGKAYRDRDFIQIKDRDSLFNIHKKEYQNA
jgi:hypothetical protein